MNAPDHRYSTFALDVHWAARQPPDAELAKHLEHCARCRAYLDSLWVLGALPSTAVTTPARQQRHGTRLRDRWLLVAAAALTVAGAGAALWKRDVARRHGDDAEERGYVATKGAPAALVLVRRSGRTSVWDGRAPVRPGDALALRVACGGMQRVSVLVPSAASSWTRISEGACPAGEALPFTLLVDAQPGEERVAVVFSRSPLDDASARRACDEPTRSEDVRTLVLVLAKSTEAP